MKLTLPKADDVWSYAALNLLFGKIRTDKWIICEILENKNSTNVFNVNDFYFCAKTSSKFRRVKVG